MIGLGGYYSSHHQGRAAARDGVRGISCMGAGIGTHQVAQKTWAVGELRGMGGVGGGGYY